MNPTNKKRDRQKSTARILQAGLEVFAELGYDAATTKIIAQRAGLNESLLHRYFKSKNGLLLAIMHSAIEVIGNETNYPPAATPAEEVFLFLTSKLAHDDLNEKFMKVIIARSLIDSEIATKVNASRPTSLDEFFKQRLRNFQKQGLILPDVDIVSLEDSIIGLSFAVGFMERILLGRDIKSCQRLFKVFSQNITRGICSPR